MNRYNRIRTLIAWPRLTIWEIALVAAIAIYCLFFSIYLAQKYDYYRTGYFDFGQSVQTVWLASQGHFNALALGRPISVIAAVLYLGYPHPITLLAFQSYAIGMGAMPVYLLAEKELRNSRYAFTFAVLYLIYFPLWGVNLYEYHDLAFSITFLLYSALFYSEKNLVGFIVSLGLALMSSPFVVVIGAAIALSIAIEYFLSSREGGNPGLLFLIATMATTLAFVAYLEAIPLLPHYEMSSLSTVSYTFTGSIAYVNPIIPLTQPLYSISYEWQSKVLYLLEIFGPLLFLPFLSIRKILPGLPWLAVVVIDTPQLGGAIGRVYILTQWSTFLIPFIFVGAIYGFKKLGERPFLWTKWITQKRALVSMAVVTVFLAAIAGGLSPISTPQIFSVADSTVPTEFVPNSLYHGVFPTPVRDRAILDSFVKQIPPNFSVLTQNQIGSKLWERLANVWTFYQPNYGDVNADAILVDYNLPGLCNECLNRALSTGNYYLFLRYDDGGIYLYFKLKPSA